MKKNDNVKVRFILGLMVLASTVQSINAQVQNYQNVSVGDNGEFYVSQGMYNLGSVPTLNRTSRTETSYGVISFAPGATWSNPDNSHYIDGYMRHYGNAAFITPIGSNGIYAPVRIQPSTATAIDAAYYRVNPNTIGTTLGTGISLISGNEYWVVKGNTSVKLSLSWRASSGISSMLLTPSLTYLTILGYDGSSWVEIPSFYDTNSFLGNLSTTSEGAITSLNEVDLSSYTAFTLGVKSTGSCFPVVASSGITKTWDGTAWSPSAPTLNDPVVINQYYTGSLSCYSMVLNADITLEDGDLLDVVDGFSGTAKVKMSSQASLLQRSNTAIAPVIEMTKVTNAMRRFDYSFLSSPLHDFATFYAHLNNKNNVAVEGNLEGALTGDGAFGAYPSSAFYYFATDNIATGGSVSVTPTNVPIGRGFTATVANQAPYSEAIASSADWANEKKNIYIKTEGQTNNGDFNVPMPTAAYWVRIGNPYPSPINANKLLDALGDNIRKTIYFWSFNTPRQQYASNSGNYNQADYATFNYTGGVAACLQCQVPTGIIGTMQSVYVKKVTATPVTFNITNCFRDLSGNDIFFRSDAANQGKFRVNLIGSNNSFSQILIGYSPLGTSAYDNGYDSQRMTGAYSSELNSLMEGSTSGYAIQTKGAFDVTDVVPLQFANRTNESFTISLADKEGVFSSGNVTIYLHDTLLNVYHDLSTGNYTFIADALSTDNSRFEIVYQNNNTLPVPDVDQINAVAFIKEGYFNAQCKVAISDVQIFDLTGRLVTSYSNLGETTVHEPFHFEEAVYLAKIKLGNGVWVTQKLTNIK